MGFLGGLVDWWIADPFRCHFELPPLSGEVRNLQNNQRWFKMASRKSKTENSKQLLAEVKPKIHQKLFEELKKRGPAVKQLTQGGLMGLFLGGIATPLVTAGGDVVKTLAAIVSGVGVNLLATLIQRYYDADSAGDEDAKQAVLDEIFQRLQIESEKSDEMLTALRELLEKVEALSIPQKALPQAEAEFVEQQLHVLRPIPADLAHIAVLLPK